MKLFTPFIINILAQYEYNAWGEVTVMDGNGIVNNNASFIGNINPYRYRGYYYDVETGFYYLQTRYYDPTICRFINADNYELIASLSTVPGQLNLYAYCGNNPIMFTDETGESFVLWAIIIGFAVGTLTSVVSQGIENGWEDINIGKACFDGAFAALSVGLAYTGINFLESMLLGAGIGMFQYSLTSYAYGEVFSVDGLLLSGCIGALGGAISNAGAQNATSLAFEVFRNTSKTATGMISNIRALTENTAFFNIVRQQFIQAAYKINVMTILTPGIMALKNGLNRLFIVD